jgi:hypothetical protein
MRYNVCVESKHHILKPTNDQGFRVLISSMGIQSANVEHICQAHYAIGTKLHNCLKQMLAAYTVMEIFDCQKN